MGGMSEANPAGEPILVLVRDLVFSSRITATARAEGAAVKVVRDAGKLPGETGKRLIVDLNEDGAIEAAVAWKASSNGEVIGFVSHVDSATIARARDAGIDRVMRRSRFVEELPQLLRSQ